VSDHELRALLKNLDLILLNLVVVGLVQFLWVNAWKVVKVCNKDVQYMQSNHKKFIISDERFDIRGFLEILRI